LSQFTPVTAQTYDPYAVQVINNLIKNNGLEAIPDKPESWTTYYNPETQESGGFVEWTEETPKKIMLLDLSDKNLTGSASFVGLKTLQTLSCFNNNLTGLDVTGCEQMYFLRCDDNKLSKLDVTNCTQLEYLLCSGNRLTTLLVKGCMKLHYLRCIRNCLNELDLYGLLNLDIIYLFAYEQVVSLTLHKNETGEYTLPISLNNPTFNNNAISYSDGILRSKDNTVSFTDFTVQTNKEGLELSGTINFTYSFNSGIIPIENPLLKIYPNPVNDTLFVEYIDSQQITVKLYDMLGGELFVQNAIGNTSISISHLEKGNYIVNVFSEDKIIGNSKIVKQ